jgi:hypothetical protein
MASLPAFEVPSTRRNSRSGKLHLDDPITAFLINMSKWLGVYLILSRRWFQRVWVLQETMLARDIVFYLGSHAIV